MSSDTDSDESAFNEISEEYGLKDVLFSIFVNQDGTTNEFTFKKLFKVTPEQYGFNRATTNVQIRNRQVKIVDVKLLFTKMVKAGAQYIPEIVLSENEMRTYDLVNCDHYGDKDKVTMLHLFTVKNCIPMIVKLINCGSNVNHQQINGNTALIEATLKSHYVCMERLIAAGANVNLQNQTGHSALMTATSRGDFRAIKILMSKKNINVNLATKMGNTALVFASIEQHEEVLRFLLSKCMADIFARRNLPLTAYCISSFQEDDKCCRILADRIIKLNLVGAFIKNRLHILSKNKTDGVLLLMTTFSLCPFLVLIDRINDKLRLKAYSRLMLHQSHDNHSKHCRTMHRLLPWSLIVMGHPIRLSKLNKADITRILKDFHDTGASAIVLQCAGIYATDDVTFYHLLVIVGFFCGVDAGKRWLESNAKVFARCGRVLDKKGKFIGNKQNSLTDQAPSDCVLALTAEDYLEVGVQNAQVILDLVLHKVADINMRELIDAETAERERAERRRQLRRKKRQSSKSTTDISKKLNTSSILCNRAEGGRTLSPCRSDADDESSDENYTEAPRSVTSTSTKMMISTSPMPNTEMTTVRASAKSSKKRLKNAMKENENRNMHKLSQTKQNGGQNSTKKPKIEIKVDQKTSGKISHPMPKPCKVKPTKTPLLLPVEITPRRNLGNGGKSALPRKEAIPFTEFMAMAFKNLKIETSDEKSPWKDCQSDDVGKNEDDENIHAKYRRKHFNPPPTELFKPPPTTSLTINSTSSVESKLVRKASVTQKPETRRSAPITRVNNVITRRKYKHTKDTPYVMPAYIIENARIKAEQRAIEKREGKKITETLEINKFEEIQPENYDESLQIRINAAVDNLFDIPSDTEREITVQDTFPDLAEWDEFIVVRPPEPTRKNISSEPCSSITSQNIKTGPCSSITSQNITTGPCSSITTQNISTGPFSSISSTCKPIYSPSNVPDALDLSDSRRSTLRLYTHESSALLTSQDKDGYPGRPSPDISTTITNDPAIKEAKLAVPQLKTEVPLVRNIITTNHLSLNLENVASRIPNNFYTSPEDHVLPPETSQISYFPSMPKGNLFDELQNMFTGQTSVLGADGAVDVTDGYPRDTVDHAGDHEIYRNPFRELWNEPLSSRPPVQINWASCSSRWNKLFEKLVKADTNCRTKVGHYHLYCDNPEMIIAQGALGNIISVGLHEDGREVAVKRMLKLNTSTVKDQALAMKGLTLDATHLCKYLDYLEDLHFGYLITDLAEMSLDEHIPNELIYRPTSWQEKAKVLSRQMLLGLRALHQRNILHRNLKPSNILITSDGHLKLADYGIFDGLCQNRADTVSGLCWKPTECLLPGESRMPYTTSSDIQVAGMLVHYILTGGNHPFGNDPAMSVLLVRQCRPKLHPNLDDITMHIMGCMLHPEPNKRRTADVCIDHPFFWSDEVQFKFILAVASQIEIRSAIFCEVTRLLNSALSWAGYINWVTRVDPYLLDFISRRNNRLYRDYLCDILSFLHDLDKEYLHLPEEIRRNIPQPSDHYRLIFPRIFLPVYDIITKSTWQQRKLINKFYS